MRTHLLATKAPFRNTFEISVRYLSEGWRFQSVIESHHGGRLMKDAHPRWTECAAHSPFRTAVQVAACALTMLGAASLAAAQKYNITDLGAFPGGSDSEGFAINFLGQVAGFADFGGSSSHAAVWSGTGLRDLGSIQLEKNFSFAESINHTVKSPGIRLMATSSLDMPSAGLGDCFRTWGPCPGVISRRRWESMISARLPVFPTAARANRTPFSGLRPRECKTWVRFRGDITARGWASI